MWTTFDLVKKITLSPSVWPCGIVDHLDLLAVEVDGDRILEGDHRQRLGGRGRHRLVAHDVLLGRQPLAHVLLGDDRRLGAEGGVVPRVVAVPVGVEHELELAAGLIPFRAARIFSASGAYWSSTIRMPSLPAETPMLPPDPSSM